MPPLHGTHFGLKKIQVAMCSAYIRISKTCPLQVWKPETVVNMLYSPKPCLPLIDCIRNAVGVLCPDCVGQISMEDGNIGVSTGSDKENESSKIGEKRPARNLDTLNNKRQKIEEDILLPNNNARMGMAIKFKHGQDKQYADSMWELLVSFVYLLKPGGIKAGTLSAEIAVTALSMLCIVFCSYPKTHLALTIFHQLHEWMHWISEQVYNNS